ncbi:unnamed protein product [Allacma fusca]|uniref:Ricin B lectin domain-containing protein n=1 Tax=Allacma fusca TaxID=39272 RepID=A0A8J2LSX8_9HEXA|nr:unnamed protein product [Allacma fusca]
MSVTSRGNSATVHQRRFGALVLRLALYSTFCGVFFIIGVEIGRQRSNDSVSSNSGQIEKETESFDQSVDRSHGKIQGVMPMPVISQPGEMGKPFKPTKLSEEQKQRIKDGYSNNGFNQYVSDLINIERSLPDIRQSRCKEPGRHLTNLPKTSIIIIFHNEAWTVLLRTVHSVINRSPPELLQEIILVDDNSTMSHLKGQLDTYMRRFVKVKIVRAPGRVGLIRARMLGADIATGEVLTFLDSHVEPTTGWLPPLLDRIARNFTTVVVPIIEVIDQDTFEFVYDSDPALLKEPFVGSFDWSLTHTWILLPERVKAEINDTSEPYPTPTMAGGLFAISKRYWEYLGKYDPGFDIWGGENLELSFKTWMCGGRLEQVPCSRVGHIFRSKSPYKGREGVEYVKNNLIRLAKVWLDDYAQYYYMTIGNQSGKEYGDISRQIALRQRLQCKPFKWYLENIIPEIFIPGYGFAYGEFRNLGFGGKNCLDSTMDIKDTNVSPILFPCHKQGGNQMFTLTDNYEIRRDGMCLDSPGDDVITFPCHGAKGNQQWMYDISTKQIVHVVSQMCLTAASSSNVTMKPCDTSLTEQRWQLQNFRTKLRTDKFDFN